MDGIFGMVGIYKRAGSPSLYALLRDPRTPTGYRRVSTGESSQAAAQGVAEKLQAEIDRQVHVSGSIRWFDAAVDFVQRGNLKPSTAKGYLSIIDNVAGSSLGNFPLRSLTHNDLRRYIKEKRESRVTINGVPDRPGLRHVSDATIRRHLSFMSAVFRWAIERDLPGAPKENPLESFNRKSLREARLIDRHLRKPQFEMILEHLESEEDKRILIVLVGTGMRLSEFLGLRWGEVDFKNRVIEFGNIDPDRTKASRARRIPILPPVYDALIAQRAIALKGRFWEETYVFPSPYKPRATTAKDGTGTSREGVQLGDIPLLQSPRSGLSALMRRIRKFPGLERFRIHDLRHTFASWALQRGIDPFAIRTVLGHTSLSTTNRYAWHVSDSVLQTFRSTDLF